MAQKKRGLGRGLQALIPEAQTEIPSRRPTDVFFPEGRARVAKADDGAKAKGRESEQTAPAAEETQASGHASHTSADIAATLLAPSKRAAKNGRKSSGNRSRQPVETTEESKSVAAKRPASEIEKKAAKAIDDVSRETAAKDPDSGKKSVSRETESPADEATDVTAEAADVETTGSQDTAAKDAPAEANDAEPGDDEKDGDGEASAEDSSGLVPVPGATFAELPVELISPNPRQPRQVFDEEDIEELASSIKEVGLLQPIVVRRIDDEEGTRYELIMGERRLRASELAGETTIPAIVRETDDGDLLRDALLENLHRAQLNPLEEASAYQQLMADFGATQEELAKRIARSRPQIANTLRLLKLPPSVQKKVAAQVITAGHARALLSLSTAQEMERLAERIVAEGLSVRTTEELVRLGKAKATPRPRTRQQRTLSPLGESVVTALSDAYDTRVSITEGRKKGRIIIEFAGEDDLQRIADLILH